MKFQTKVALVAAAILSLTLSACGSDSLTGGGEGPSPDVSVSANTDLNSMLPEAIRTSGKIKIGTDASYAPNQFTEGNTIKGSEVDLFNAVAQTLGIEAEWENAQFASLIPGVTSAKYDIGVSSFTINEKRLEQVLMVSYFEAGTQWATAAGNPAGVDPNNPCGKKIAVQKATVQDLEDLPARQKKCGSNPMEIQQFTGQDTATAAVATNKADAMLADSPIAAYAVQQSGGKLELVGEVYDAAPYGVVVAKDQQQLADAVAAALTQMKTDGTYLKVLEAWGVQAGAVDTFEVKP